MNFRLRDIFDWLFLLATGFGLLRFVCFYPQMIPPVISLLSFGLVLLIPTLVEEIDSKRRRIMATFGIMASVVITSSAAAMVVSVLNA